MCKEELQNIRLKGTQLITEKENAAATKSTYAIQGNQLYCPKEMVSPQGMLRVADSRTRPMHGKLMEMLQAAPCLCSQRGKHQTSCVPGREASPGSEWTNSVPWWLWCTAMVDRNWSGIFWWLQVALGCPQTACNILEVRLQLQRGEHIMPLQKVSWLSNFATMMGWSGPICLCFSMCNRILILNKLILDVDFTEVDPPHCPHANLLACWNLSTCLNLLQAFSAQNNRATTVAYPKELRLN